MFARLVLSAAGSQLDLSAPSFSEQDLKNTISGSDGNTGRHGAQGPKGRLCGKRNA